MLVDLKKKTPYYSISIPNANTSSISLPHHGQSLSLLKWKICIRPYILKSFINNGIKCHILCIIIFNWKNYGFNFSNRPEFIKRADWWPNRPFVEFFFIFLFKMAIRTIWWKIRPEFELKMQKALLLYKHDFRIQLINNTNEVVPEKKPT